MEADPRRVLVLLRHLPPDSAIGRAQTGGVNWGWQEEALITQAELIHALIRVTLAAHGTKKHHIPKPLHIDRPWELAQRKARPQATVEDAVSFLDALFRGGL